MIENDKLQRQILYYVFMAAKPTSLQLRFNFFYLFNIFVYNPYIKKIQPNTYENLVRNQSINHFTPNRRIGWARDARPPRFHQSICSQNLHPLRLFLFLTISFDFILDIIFSGLICSLLALCFR